MFLNITEEQVLANCPKSRPMTLQEFNKISPMKQNSSVSILNPYIEPRFAPSSISQLVLSSSSALNLSEIQSEGLRNKLIARVETDQELLSQLPDVPVKGVEETKGEMSTLDKVLDEKADALLQIDIIETALENPNLTEEQRNYQLESLGYYKEIVGDQTPDEEKSDMELLTQTRQSRLDLEALLDAPAEEPKPNLRGRKGVKINLMTPEKKAEKAERAERKIMRKEDKEANELRYKEMLRDAREALTGSGY